MKEKLVERLKNLQSAIGSAQSTVHHIASESDFEGDQVWDLLDDAKSLVEEQIEDIESELTEEDEDDD
jgi:hypothetical protein